MQYCEVLSAPLSCSRSRRRSGQLNGLHLAGVRAAGGDANDKLSHRPGCGFRRIDIPVGSSDRFGHLCFYQLFKFTFPGLQNLKLLFQTGYFPFNLGPQLGRL